MSTGAIDCFNRLNLGSGHGWTGAFHVFWNCQAATGSFQAPAYTSNWVVGFRGVRTKPVYVDPRFASTPYNATFISEGKAVKPWSLYLWQLEQRMGRAAVRRGTARRDYSEPQTPTSTTTLIPTNSPDSREQDPSNSGKQKKGEQSNGTATETPGPEVLEGKDVPWFLRRPHKSAATTTIGVGLDKHAAYLAAIALVGWLMIL